MITGGVENLIKWIEDNDITEWTLTTRPETKANFFIFKSNSGVPREREIERMKNILSYIQTISMFISMRNPMAKPTVAIFRSAGLIPCTKGQFPMGLAP